jgi:hypothetical protein
MSDEDIDTSNILQRSEEFFHRRLKLYKSAFGHRALMEIFRARKPSGEPEEENTHDLSIQDSVRFIGCLLI